ncbi:MAG: TatD family hydrolase [Magnetococcales bacterium]|nr:TatD family hydrolase [Magnetococcales bacterium]
MTQSHILLIDTHAHLCDDRFTPDLSAVIDRAQQAGVETIIAVSETLQDAHKTLEMAKKDQRIRPALGLYPGYANRDDCLKMVELIKQNRDDIIAIGEVGLDYKIAREAQQQSLQRDVFTAMIRLAKREDLPLNVHSRSAEADTVKILLDNAATRVQLHAFHGKHKIALRAVDAGYFISIPASVVRSGQLQELAAKIPMDNLLLETDSPVMSPFPDQRNEPCNIVPALPVLAKIKGVSEQQCRTQLWENCLRLYGPAIQAC